VIVIVFCWGPASRESRPKVMTLGFISNGTSKVPAQVSITL
jgi:hypothetical protein